MVTETYGVYVVRIWLEERPLDKPAWRASVTDTSTKDKHYFADPTDLSAFLLATGVTPDLESPRKSPDL